MTETPPPVRGNPLSIVHVAAPAPVGGLERVVQALAIGHRAVGHRVTVVAVLGADVGRHPLVESLRDAGVEVIEMRLPPRAYLRERREMRTALRRIRPDVVHTHGYRPDLLDAGVARALGIPVVSTLHGSSRLGGASHMFEWLQLRALRRFDAVIAVSRPLATMLAAAGVPEARIALIPNAWPGVEPRLSRKEARSRLGLPPDGWIVGFVGRLIPAKGPDVLIGALSRLPTDLPWHACVIGDGGLRSQLEGEADRGGWRSRVTFAGHVDEATHLYRAFDVFVLSSRTEGTPIALLEAMAAEVPVIASAVGGVPDVLGVDHPGLVAPEQPAALARALLTAARAGAGAAALLGAASARARVVGDFGPAAWLLRHEELYRSSGRGGRTGTQ